MDNFKGIYYGKYKDNKTFEGGAYFQYNELFNILNELYQRMPNERKGNQIQDSLKPKSPLIKELVNRIKEITNVKIDEIRKGINLNNPEYNQMFPQCLTEESEEKDEGTNTNDTIFQLERHFMETRNKKKIYDILNAEPNTKITISNNKNQSLEPNKPIITHNHPRIKKLNVISPLCYIKKHKDKITNNIDSFLKTKVKNVSIGHNRISSNTSSINIPQKTKKSIYQLVYKRKKSNDENSNSISKSKVKVTINNNIIIRPKINISFINRVDSKSKEKIHLSQKKKRIIQSRNGKFNVHYVNLNSTIGYGNKTFNYGINEDIIKNTNNSKCIKYTVNPNKKQKKPNNTNNLKALYQKRKNNTKLSYDFEHFFKNKDSKDKLKTNCYQGEIQYKK